MEKLSERLSLRQIQCSEYRRGLWHWYSPRICRTTTSESEYTCSTVACKFSAYCSASSSATYSATLLSCWPIHLEILMGTASGWPITTPIPDGPGLPSEPPST